MSHALDIFFRSRAVNILVQAVTLVALGTWTIWPVWFVLYWVWRYNLPLW